MTLDAWPTIADNRASTVSPTRTPTVVHVTDVVLLCGAYSLYPVLMDCTFLLLCRARLRLIGHNLHSSFDNAFLLLQPLHGAALVS